MNLESTSLRLLLFSQSTHHENTNVVSELKRINTGLEKKFWIIGEVGYKVMAVLWCYSIFLFIEPTLISSRTGMKPFLVFSWNEASSYFTVLLWLCCTCVKHVLTFKAKRYSKISNTYSSFYIQYMLLRPGLNLADHLFNEYNHFYRLNYSIRGKVKKHIP